MNVVHGTYGEDRVDLAAEGGEDSAVFFGGGSVALPVSSRLPSMKLAAPDLEYKRWLTD